MREAEKKNFNEKECYKNKYSHSKQSCAPTYGFKTSTSKVRWRDLRVHHTYLQNPLDCRYSKTLTQEGSDTTVQAMDLQLLSATNNLLKEGGVAVVVLTIRLYLMGLVNYEVTPEH